MTGVRVARLPKHTAVIQQRLDGTGSARHLLLPANLHPSLTWAAGEGERRPPASLHHYHSSRGQNSLPSIPPPAPKLPSKNDQLPELGATGRNRKIRPDRWLLNASTRRKRNDRGIVTWGIFACCSVSRLETGSHQIFKLSSKLKSIKVIAWQNRSIWTRRG